MVTCSSLELILVHHLNTINNLTLAILHKTGISQVLLKLSSLKELDMIIMGSSNPKLSSSNHLMGPKLVALVTTTVSHQLLVGIANKDTLKKDMRLDTKDMANRLLILSLGMISARVMALLLAMEMRLTLQLKMVTLLPMVPKVRLLKHRRLGNHNRDTLGASLVLTLHTQLSLVMVLHQPHNPVMGLHLYPRQVHTLAMGHHRARKHHQTHQCMVSLSNHHLR